MSLLVILFLSGIRKRGYAENLATPFFYASSMRGKSKGKIRADMVQGGQGQSHLYTYKIKGHIENILFSQN